MPQIPMIVFSVRVPPRIVRKVKADAKKAGTTATQIVAAILMRHYEQEAHNG